MINKRILFIFLSLAFLIILQTNLISAGLCKGIDDYYHECEYVSYSYQDGIYYKTVIDLSKKQIYDDWYRYDKNRYDKYNYDYKRYDRDYNYKYDRNYKKDYHRYYPIKKYYRDYDDYYEIDYAKDYKKNLYETLYSYYEPRDYPSYYVYLYTQKDYKYSYTEN